MQNNIKTGKRHNNWHILIALNRSECSKSLRRTAVGVFAAEIMAKKTQNRSYQLRHVTNLVAALSTPIIFLQIISGYGHKRNVFFSLELK